MPGIDSEGEGAGISVTALLDAISPIADTLEEYERARQEGAQQPLPVFPNKIFQDLTRGNRNLYRLAKGMN